MNCSNCNAELEVGATLCPSCGTEVVIQNKNPRKGRLRIILAAMAGIIFLLLSVLLVFIFNKKPVSSPTAPPDQVFYLKDKALYQTLVDDIQPKEVVSELIVDQTGPAPIYLSGDGNWLFYPQGPRSNADVYGYQLTSEQENRVKIASQVGLFTPNRDASKIFFLAGHELYTGTMEKYDKVDSQVERYFLNEEGNRMVYVTTDGTLYVMKENKAPQKLVEKVSLRFVSRDLKTIYYVQDESLYLVKNMKAVKEVMHGNLYSDHPMIAYVYENGDIYYKNNSNLYYYSGGKSKLVGNNCSYVLANSDNTYIYPYRVLYGGTNVPLIIYEDTNSNLIICKGAEILKKITGGFLRDAVFDPNGKGLYYIAAKDRMNMEGDLFYAAIDKTTLSESKKIAAGVSSSGIFNVGNKFVYFKNAVEVGDLYIDEKMIDTGVTTWIFAWTNTVLGPDSFVYTKNSRDYYSESVNDYYTMDTLMLYQNGETRTLADNVIDFSVYGDKVVYLTVADPDASSGTLYLYEGTGEARVIDTEVNAIIRPTSDRELGGEIDPNYGVSYFYME